MFNLALKSESSRSCENIQINQQNKNRDDEIEKKKSKKKHQEFDEKDLEEIKRSKKSRKIKTDKNVDSSKSESKSHKKEQHKLQDEKFASDKIQTKKSKGKSNEVEASMRKSLKSKKLESYDSRDSKKSKEEDIKKRNIRNDFINKAVAKGELKLIDKSKEGKLELQEEIMKQDKDRKQRIQTYINLNDNDFLIGVNPEEMLDIKIELLSKEINTLKENIKHQITHDGENLNEKTDTEFLMRKRDWLKFKSLELDNRFDSSGCKYEMLIKKVKAMQEALKYIESTKVEITKLLKYRQALRKYDKNLAEAQNVLNEMSGLAFNLLPRSVSNRCKQIENTRKRLMDLQDNLLERKYFAKKDLATTKNEIKAVNEALEGEKEATNLLKTRKLQELQRFILFQAKKKDIDKTVVDCNRKLEEANLTIIEAQELANLKKSRGPLDRVNEAKLKEKKIEELNHINAMMEEEAANLDAQIFTTNAEITEIERMNEKNNDIINTLKFINELNNSRRLLSVRLQNEKTLKKSYYNQIEDMKGAIRVYCRVRPKIKTEEERKDEICVDFPDIYTVVIKQPEKKIVSDREKEYVFDKVFQMNSTQKEIFHDIEKLIETVFTGFNVCIFAYGQTGSGKTHTLIGEVKSEREMGIVPRAFQKFYEIIEMTKSHIKTETTFYMIELYNDKLLDLMKTDAIHEENLKIMKNEHGMVIVPGVTMLTSNSCKDMFSYFDLAVAHRHIACTKLNSQSSRSHLILTVMFKFQDIEANKNFYGKISIVDLAGSERLTKSGSVGINKTEATSINKALTSLGDVISALTSMNKGFVPYRNNKLTLLMQDSLGGTAKTLMIVNLSPMQYNSSESINSLNYAARMKTIINENLKVYDADEYQKLKDIIVRLLEGKQVIIE